MSPSSGYTECDENTDGGDHYISVFHISNNVLFFFLVTPLNFIEGMLELKSVYTRSPCAE